MQTFFLVGSAEDSAYVPSLRQVLSQIPGATLVSSAEQAKYIILTNPKALREFFAARAGLTLENYAGSTFEKAGKRGVVLQPLKQLFSVPYGSFIAKHYLDKLISPQLFMRTPLEWKRAHLSDLQALEQSAYLACDIETGSELNTTCVGFTLISSDLKIGRTIVFPLREEWEWLALRSILSGRAVKIFQNGSYDLSYLVTRYGFVVNHYLFDTLHMFHAWYAELPKRLDFISAFCCLDHYYWKQEAKNANSFDEYLAYNAKDCHATAQSFVYLAGRMPDWAWNNFYLTFRLAFPNLVGSSRGLVVNPVSLARLKQEQLPIVEKELTSIRFLLDDANFNPGSYIQIRKYMGLIERKPVSESDAKSLVKLKHPLSRLIVDKLLAYRKAAKLCNTYLNATTVGGRLFFQLHSAKTDTGRLASSKSNFWCGTQIQNIPSYYKQCLEASPGMLLGEADFSQGESRTTAYIADDPDLIYAVENSPDFHSHNASAFFGIPFDQIFDVATGKVLNKPLRDLSKRTNHGANYNMGENIMIETMGEKRVWEAGRLLGLDKKIRAALEITRSKLSRAPVVSIELAVAKLYTLKFIAGYLLDRFAKTYKRVKGGWQLELIREVAVTGKLVNPSGWVRRCFGNPARNKSDLNAIIAHNPQHLSAFMLNNAWYDAWLTLHEEGKFHLIASIHDSILFEYIPGEEWRIEKLRLLLERPQKVPSGKTFFIPSVIKFGKKVWSEL